MSLVEPWMCSKDATTSFITKLIVNAYLKEETRRELQYVLPLKNRHMFPEFFSVLDSKLMNLSIKSYGLKDVSLEEVFLKITEEYKQTSTIASNDLTTETATTAGNMSDNTEISSSSDILEQNSENSTTESPTTTDTKSLSQLSEIKTNSKPISLLGQNRATGT
ncbi:unnamed protein product, partial [Didymodactylos carnosus]